LLVTILLGLFCFIFNLIGYFQKSDWGLKFSFLLIFLFLGFRYNFGNDYETYIGLFNKVDENPAIAFDQKIYIFYEPGWMFLNWFLRPIGFFGMTLVISLVYSITIYKLIKKYIPFQYYWLAVFIVVFNPEFLLVHSTIMRQMVAIVLFLLSLNYILENRILHFIIFISLAATFHYSALIVLIIAPFLFDNRRVSFILGIVLFSVYLLSFFLGNFLSLYIDQLVFLFSENYGNYTDKGKSNTGLGFLFYSSLFLLILNLEKFQEKKISFFFKLVIVYLMLMPFKLHIEMISRVGMYFSPAVVVIYPLILKTIKLKILKIFFLSVIMLFTIYQFFQFFFSATYKDYFMEYHSIFSAPKWN
jgi:hypothetical protein